MRKDNPAFFEVFKSAIYGKDENSQQIDSQQPITVQPEQQPIQNYTFSEPQRKHIKIYPSTILLALLIYLLTAFISFYLGARLGGNQGEPNTNIIQKPDPKDTSKNNDIVTPKAKWTIMLGYFDFNNENEKNQAIGTANSHIKQLIESKLDKARIETKNSRVTLYYGEYNTTDSKEAKETLEKLKKFKYKTKTSEKEIYKGAGFVKINNGNP